MRGRVVIEQADGGERFARRLEVPPLREADLRAAVVRVRVVGIELERGVEGFLGIGPALEAERTAAELHEKIRLRAAGFLELV